MTSFTIRYDMFKQLFRTMMSPSIVGPFTAFLYGCCSASMAFANKAVLTSYAFNYPFFLVTCQMVFSIIILEALRLTGKTTLVPFTLARGWMFILPSTCYAANCVLSLSALEGMNIPMYGVIKRCSPVAILLLGVTVLGKPLPSKLTCLSVVMITVGCLIAGFGDMKFDLGAYTCGAASVLTQSIYLLIVQKHADDIGAAEGLHLNSYNTLPMLLICSIGAGEFQSALANFRVTDIGFVLTFSIVIVFACLLNYLLFLCTTLNSALTTGVTGTLKSIFQTAIGMFTFGGISINVLTVLGILVNFAGGILYTFIKFRDSQSSKKTKSVTRLTIATNPSENVGGCNEMTRKLSSDTNVNLSEDSS